MPEEPAAAAATVGAMLAAARRRIAASGSGTPDLDARLLLAEATGAAAAEVHSGSGRGVDGEAERRFRGFVQRRELGEPVHRIIGRRAFYDHEFLLSPETLEPRPDTELLVDAARAFMAPVVAERGACRFVDVGTGTGAIAVSLLALFPAAEAIATDISEGALATARANAAAAGVDARLRTLRTDYLAGIAGPLDLVVSNPPYVRHRDISGLSREVREHDPVAALDGGPDGLDAYRAIARQVGAVIATKGNVLVEIGAGQDRDVEEIFAGSGLRLVTRLKDLGGIVRVLGFVPASA